MARDPAYDNALKRRNQLIREIEEINKFLALYEQFSSSDTEGNISGDDSRFVRVPSGRISRNALPPLERPIRQAQFVKEARKIILDHERPMTRSELLNAFNQKGIRVGGTNESKNLGTKMWRARDVFINLPGEGYWLADIACPAVGYEPKSDLFQETDQNSN